MPVANAQMPWCVGDLVLFSGESFFSRIVRARTCSPYSHVGIIAKVGLGDLVLSPKRSKRLPGGLTDTWRKRKLLFESTTLNDLPCEILQHPIEGTQAHDPAVVAATYKGRIWRQSLREEWQLTFPQSSRLTESLLNNLGVEYDMPGAMLSGTLILKWLGCGWRASDRSTLVCVEYVAQAIKDAFAFSPCSYIGNLHPGKMTPKQLVRWAWRTMYMLPVLVQ